MSRRAPSYLLLNGFNIYHLRLPVPKHLRSVIKQREIKRSLQTGNRQEAMRKARILAGKYQEVFDQMSKFDDEVNELLNNPFLKKLEVDIIHKPDGTIELKGLKMDPNRPEVEKDLLDHAMRKIKDVRGDLSVLAPEIPNKNITFKELVEEYLDATAVHIEEEKTIKGYRSHLETWLEIITDVPINQITRKRARESLVILKQLPPNRNKVRAYKNLSIDSIIKLHPEKTLSETTVNLHIERVSACFLFAIKERLAGFNPFDDLKIKKKTRPDQEREEFAEADIAALFDSNNFKPSRKHPSRWIIMKIAALSGMRLEEICQLDQDDVKIVDDVWCFDINDAGQKKLKNRSAHRLVPIHSKILTSTLQDLTFLDYVGQCQGGRLFPDLKRANGKLGHHYSKWFGRYKKKCGIVGAKSLHSFRHSAASIWKRASIDVNKSAAILGHSVEGQTYGRYGKGYTAKQLKEVIELIDFGSYIP